MTLHQVQDVLFMFLFCLTIHCNVIVYTNHSGIPFNDLVHAYLEDIVGYFKVKWYPQELIPAQVSVTGHYEMTHT